MGAITSTGERLGPILTTRVKLAVDMQTYNATNSERQIDGLKKRVAKWRAQAEFYQWAARRYIPPSVIRRLRNEWEARGNVRT